MQQPDGLLPPKMGEIVSGTEERPEDRIVSLKDDLETTQSALEKEIQKNQELEAEVELLRDNTKIKKDAVWYAKVFMVVIPMFCTFMLIASVTKGISYPLGDEQITYSWSVEVKDYAQAAFVVTPVLFVATVLGFLLRGVFRTSSKQDEVGLAKLGQTLGTGN